MMIFYEYVRAWRWRMKGKGQAINTQLGGEHRRQLVGDNSMFDRSSIPAPSTPLPRPASPRPQFITWRRAATTRCVTKKKK